MPNKMTTTKLSLAAAALLALAYPAWGAQPKKWECEHEDIEELHTIEVTYKESGQDLPAFVKYSKNGETRKLYYCTERCRRLRGEGRKTRRRSQGDGLLRVRGHRRRLVTAGGAWGAA